MTRPSTFTRVVAAVLELAERGGPEALTMEGIAAAAGVGKQSSLMPSPSSPATSRPQKTGWIPSTSCTR